MLVPDADVFCVSLDASGGVGAGCNKMTEMMMKTMMTAAELV